jgi:hypothetical protein
MKKLNLIILLLCLLPFASFAQKKSLASIDQKDLKSYMMFFSSDELQGRETGTRSNDEAALFIKSNLMRLGLKPAPGMDDFFQKIPMISTKIDRNNSGLFITGNNDETLFSTDSIVTFSFPSESKSITGKLVFAGYGYKDKSGEYNDLRDLDLKDKIVLIMTRTPGDVKSDTGKEIFNNNIEAPKIMSIIAGGAKAVLLVYDPAHRFRNAWESGIAEMLPSGRTVLKGEKDFSMPGQISFITQTAASALLKPAGSNLAEMQEKIANTGAPVSSEIPDITVTLKSNVERKEFFAPNVIGILEGSDPVLRNECVVYSAHFDHTGISQSGEVNNGADDNASGSMALLEVAEAFMNLEKRPLRSVVFAWVNAEEKGLLGSQYYTDNPVFPMEKTVVDINLDMVGRSKMPSDTGKFFGMPLDISNPGEIYVYTAHESSELLKMMYAAAEKAGLKVIDKGKNIEYGSSDHASFMSKGVPALMVHSGVHADLHSPRDDYDKIDFDKMEKASKMVFLIGLNVANQKTRIVVDNPVKKE